MIRLEPPHPSPLLVRADALRHAGSLCDVVFSLEGQTFGAHCLVLACTSPTLAPRLLQGGPADRPLRCTLDFCSPRTFQQVLDYSYGQALAVPPADLGPLRTAAGLLGMRPLEEQCRGLLGSLDYRAAEVRRALEELEESRAGPGRRREGPPCRGETGRGDSSAEGETGREEEEESSGPPTSPPPPPSDTPQGQTSVVLSRKRALPSSPPAGGPYARDSVIRASSPCSPRASVTSPPAWASANHWHHVTLRLMAQRYSDRVAERQHPFSQGPQSGLLAQRAPDFANVQSQRPPDLEDMVRRDLKRMGAASDGSESRYLKRIPGAQHVFVNPHHASLLTERCTASSGEAYRRYRTGGEGGGLSPPQPGAKPFQCLRCPKRFSLKHQLDTHHRVHTGEKPFECRLCGQRSRDYSAMIKHLRTHGGAGPYQCTACSDYCSSLAAMQKHVERHAPQDFPPDWTIRRTYLYTSHV
ncbi:unnamed protein product [Boreogadus saida]